MNILVTGGAGYIGSHTVHLLRDLGHNLIVVDNLSRGDRRLLPAKTRLFVLDCSNSSAISAILQAYEIDAIIHFAGSVVVPESVRDPLFYYHNNTTKTRDLLEIAVKNGIKKFIFSSTAAVYGTPSAVPVRESSDLRPLSPYGYSKLMSEKMLEHVSDVHSLKFVTLRYFNVAGADPLGRTGLSSPNATHIFKMCVEAASGERSSVQIYGDDYPTRDGTGIRDYIHVYDLASAHIHALQYLVDGGDSIVLNCGYGCGYSVREVIEAVKTVSNTDFAVEVASRRPGDMAEIYADTDKISKHLRWRPKYNDLTAIATDAFRWEMYLRSNKSNRGNT